MNLLAQWRTISRSEKALCALFLLTLPLVNPWVRGDGVGYYAYARSLLIDGDLRFENEWLAGNPNFVARRLDDEGRLNAASFTATGYVNNNFAVGPALLWAPFLVVVHGLVLAAQKAGASVAADGYSWPYTVTMALTTAGYGLAALWIAFRLARRYFAERWALLATLGIWFGSSLPVYMYFNPSWAHAHSGFTVALFVWYWHGTRGQRTLGQWMVLGLLGGLMLNVYYPTVVVLLLPLLESLRGYAGAVRGEAPARSRVVGLFAANVVFATAVAVALLPTLITRQIIYGHPFRTGYPGWSEWNWTSPAFVQVLFSANHGLLSWTPLVALAIAGLFLLRRADRQFGMYCLIVFLAFYYLIASYGTWHGLASFGNRFFISLTPLFVLGLAATLDSVARLWTQTRRATVAAALMLAIFVAWNLGFILQWGTQMVPARGPISFREVARNQFTAVPRRLVGALEQYLARRAEMMDAIERRDRHTSTPEKED